MQLENQGNFENIMNHDAMMNLSKDEVERRNESFNSGILNGFEGVDSRGEEMDVDSW